MAYLNTPNLVFTGDFIADTSTVNNDVRHYQNSSFQPYFQELPDPNDPNIMNGWWNPTGGNVFAFQNCNVQQISFPDGSVQHVAGGTDAVLSKLVGGPEGRATGKMLDMDPQWQMSSQLWCVKLRIYSDNNELFLSGDFAVSGFRDLQMRQTDGGAANGQPMGGGWTSVLTNVAWGDAAAGSPFLSALKNTTQNNILSIQLNMFGFYYSHNDGRFTMGRMIGTIGPWFAKEPKTFAPCRRLYGVMDWGNANIFFQYSNFLVDHANASLNIDVGGSFPIADSMGTIAGNTVYTLGILNAGSDFVPPASGDWQPVYLQPGDFQTIGDINYTSGNNNWLNTTGGILQLKLTESQLQLLAGHQLVLVTPSTTNPGSFVMVCRESIGGYNFRADNHNERLENGLTKNIELYAYQWGKPVAGYDFTFAIQPKTQAFFGGQTTGRHAPTAPIPYVNVPTDGLTFGTPGPTDTNGKCVLSIAGNKINNPRGYLDGQIYYISYNLTVAPADAAAYGMDAIYISLRDYYQPPAEPTWDDVSGVLSQFGNVYPLMSKFIVDLGSAPAVLSKKDILIYAFTRDIDDPFYMPVTRDLSDAMRRTIVKWLNNPLPGKEDQVGQLSEAVAAATGPLDESDEIKRTKQLTEAKNGSMRFRALPADPFLSI
jgi:hypothetical protein